MFATQQNDQIIPIAQEKSAGIRLMNEVARLMTASFVSHAFLSVAWKERMKPHWNPSASLLLWDRDPAHRYGLGCLLIYHRAWMEKHWQHLESALQTFLFVLKAEDGVLSVKNLLIDVIYIFSLPVLSSKKCILSSSDFATFLSILVLIMHLSDLLGKHGVFTHL